MNIGWKYYDSVKWKIIYEKFWDLMIEKYPIRHNDLQFQKKQKYFIKVKC